MARVRRLLNGVVVETAQRKRICYHDRNDHQIQQGSVCLIIKEANGSGSKNYCVSCALEILDRAAGDIESLRQQLK
jgi:hypothetical protein